MRVDGLPVRQIAYFVPDIRVAAVAHHQRFGSGPFFVAEHIPLKRSLHRGTPRLLDHSSAYGQWGALMVEFVQQNNNGPSAFHDLYPEGSGQFGMHHLAVFIDDLRAAVAGHEAEGHAVALDAETESGVGFAMIDMTNALGHMVELYEPSAGLLSFYERIASAAGDFDGTELLRPLG